MKIEHEGNHLRVSDIAELNAINATSFRDEVRAAMPSDPATIEIDLSQTRFVDSSGLGALFALYKAANNNHDGVTLRLLNPRPSIQQLFELTQLHQLFEISKRVAFKCDLTESRIATRLLRAFLSEQGLDESEQFNCELCLAEACNNAVQNATEVGARLPVVAEATVLGASVELRVTDRTNG